MLDFWAVTLIKKKKIQKGAVAKSYTRKGFLIYEEMRKYLVIYEEALVIYDFATALRRFLSLKVQCWNFRTIFGG